MSVQALGALIGGRYAIYAAWINALALFLAVAGSWLLVATRIRYSRAMARVAAKGKQAGGYGMDAATARINRFFTSFGAACLGLALAVSWFSTQL
ncbi:hypothetical protein [Pseudomonas sp. 5P_3.1_Bac2]|uniref:hypothetical protein n=1 Tax=Pseudomonas sp. 5P_3.1_Bac2 TaxID=2971617 RepID=UPI0021C87080|nr:hypothetical protein [Pseudomonas sp. 5P_3.1_Bac2]MCU1718836.1 hypothetical protein [Pseudomonas sp. 5P_3.1_Bac2]